MAWGISITHIPYDELITIQTKMPDIDNEIDYDIVRDPEDNILDILDIDEFDDLKDIDDLGDDLDLFPL